MIDKANHKHKKSKITEDDISTLLQRYTATTVLALLQEVSQWAGAKIDWEAMVKKTNTGISSAREYQMLWRHLAYHHPLLLSLGTQAEPLDDDSDLECELEAFPDVTSEATTEAAACVKVLIASGAPNDSSHPNNTTVEAPLTINIPNGHSIRAPSDHSQPGAVRGMNITVPVSVQKQHLPAVASTEGFDVNGSSGTLPPRKRRKPWSEAEDMELIAAVKKYGEGNWANILRGEFKGDRTASQLSQRWAIIRKRRDNLNRTNNSSGLQLSEAQRAARHAMHLALDPPAKNIITNSSSGTTLNSISNNSLPSATAESSAQHQAQHPIMAKSSLGSLDSTGKPPLTLKATLAKSSFSSDPVRAAAVAAGARIATQSDAASLLKAAQAKNAVHIMQGGSSIKPSVPGGVSTHMDSTSNVHYFATSPAAAPRSTHPGASSSGLCHISVKASTSTQITPFSSGASNKSSELANTELPPKQDAKIAEGIEVSSLEAAAKKQVQQDGTGNELRKQVEEDRAALPKQEAECKQVQEDKPALPNQEAKCNSLVVENSNTAMKLEMVESDNVDVSGSKAEGRQNENHNETAGTLFKEGEDQSAVQENGEGARQEDISSMLTDDCAENGQSQADPALHCKNIGTEI